MRWALECSMVLCGAALHALHMSLPCPQGLLSVGWAGVQGPDVRCRPVLRHSVMQGVMLGQASYEKLNT